MPLELALGLASIIFKKPLEGLYSQSNQKAKRYLKRFRDERTIQELRAKIGAIENVRTIATRNTLSLKNLYYPSRIITSTGSASVTSISDLDNGHHPHILISGTVGQGKSLLLKYLCLSEIDNNETLPIFIELRRIGESQNLTGLIKDQINCLQLTEDADDEFLNTALKTRAISLFLDGFDEVPSAYAQRTSDEIKLISNRFNSLKIIITSRPTDISQHLDQLAEFNHLKIQPLSNLDFSPFFQKIGVSDDVRSNLLSAIANSSSEIQELLTTPLMLTLLVSSCGGRSVLPDTLPDFYDALFSIMVSTHDETKPGYIREKSTGLSNTQLEGLFKTFCYASKTYEATSLSPAQFTSATKQAIKHNDLNCTPEQFRSDIINVACLMAKDGINTSFIHKSIQEYFTAAFISEITEDSAIEAIYTRIRTDIWNIWKQELSFLSQIDKQRCIKHYYIPSATSVLKFFEFNSSSKVGATKASIKKAVRILNIRIYTRDDKFRKSVPLDVAKEFAETEYMFKPFDGIDKIYKDFNIRDSPLIDQLNASANAQESIYRQIRKNLKALSEHKIELELSLEKNRTNLMELINIH